MSEKEKPNVDKDEFKAPVIRGVLINLIWDTMYQSIFNEKIKPALTFEEVHILQNRLDEYVEMIKFKALTEFDEQPDSKTPINDSSYVK